MNHEKRSVSLEDLLRLKRAEQPPPEFWNEFDRQLRAKQLAALVGKRSWWHGFHRAFSPPWRYQLPFGAAAVLAVTMISLYDGGTGQVDAPEVTTSSPVAVSDARVEPVADVTLDRHASISSPASAEVMAADIDPAPAALPIAGGEAQAEDRPGVVVAEASSALAVISPFEAITGTNAEAEPDSPSARFIAANFAAARISDAVGATLLPATHGFESRGIPVRAATVEPLQQMTPPGEFRRSARYQAAMLTAASFVDAAPRVTERVANRISPEELYDQVRRIGTRRGGFNVKF